MKTLRGVLVDPNGEGESENRGPYSTKRSLDYGLCYLFVCLFTYLSTSNEWMNRKKYSPGLLIAGAFKNIVNPDSKEIYQRMNAVQCDHAKGRYQDTKTGQSYTQERRYLTRKQHIHAHQQPHSICSSQPRRHRRRRAARPGPPTP